MLSEKEVIEICKQLLNFTNKDETTIQSLIDETYKQRKEFDCECNNPLFYVSPCENCGGLIKYS